MSDDEFAPRRVDERHAQAVKAVRADLASLPDLYAQLWLFRLPGSLPPDPDGHHTHSSNPSRPPLNLDVLDLEDDREKPDSEPQRTDYELDRMAGARRQGVLPTLASWVRLVDGELWDDDKPHDPPAEDPSVATEVSFLLANLEWIGEQRWFSELAADVRTMRNDIRRSIGDRDPLPMYCPDCDWHVESMDNGTWFRCTGCPSKWTRFELHKLELAQRPKTLAEISVLVNVPVKTLHRWAKNRWIKPVARNGSALYSLSKVRSMAIKVQRRPQEVS